MNFNIGPLYTEVIRVDLASFDVIMAQTMEMW